MTGGAWGRSRELAVKASRVVCAVCITYGRGVCCEMVCCGWINGREWDGWDETHASLSCAQQSINAAPPIPRSRSLVLGLAAMLLEVKIVNIRLLTDQSSSLAPLDC